MLGIISKRFGKCTATEIRKPRNNTLSVIGVCAVVLLKYRFKQLRVFQKIMGLVL